MKGKGSELDLTSWLRKIVWPLSGLISPKEMAAAAMLSAVEAVKAGTSIILDQLTVGTSPEGIEEVSRAYERVGIRAVLAIGLSQRTKRAELWNIPKERFPYTLEESTRIVRDAIGKLARQTGRDVSIWPAPVTIFSAGPDVFKAAWEICEEYGCGLHTHIAETTSEVDSTLEDYSCREVQLLSKLGVLGRRTSIAHGIWLDDDEIGLLASTKTSVVHCPLSNMYLGSGVAKVPQMLARGVNVALGTDGGTCGSTHEMFGAMKTAALLHKVHNRDPRAVSAYDVLHMATMGGARALGLEHEIGSIESGKSADFTLLDLGRMYSSPVGDVVSNIVYYSSPSNVDAVWIRGKPVVSEGKLLTMDEGRVLREGQDAARQLDAKISARS
jgi:5-methylthioadenosine/S-adenosylhomocysteine deaminase